MRESRWIDRVLSSNPELPLSTSVEFVVQAHGDRSIEVVGVGREFPESHQTIRGRESPIEAGAEEITTELDKVSSRK